METNESNGVLEFELHGLATTEQGWRKEQCPEKKHPSNRDIHVDELMSTSKLQMHH